MFDTFRDLPFLDQRRRSDHVMLRRLYIESVSIFHPPRLGAEGQTTSLSNFKPRLTLSAKS
jgi:hypothetical protein